MRYFNTDTSAPAEPRGAAPLTAAFAALFIGVGAIVVSGASAASNGPPAPPPPAAGAVTSAAEAEPTTPATALATTALPSAGTETDAAQATPGNALAEPAQAAELTFPDAPEPIAAAPLGLRRVDLRPVPAPPVTVVFGLGDAPTGCAAGCITNVTVEQIAAGSTDMLMSVHTDTPAEVIVSMMALDQGDDPVGGDPYAGSHGLVTEWTIELVDLLPGTTYEYAVVAFDDHGGTDTYGGTFTTAMQLNDKITTEVPVEVCTVRCDGLHDLAIHAERS